MMFRMCGRTNQPEKKTSTVAAQITVSGMTITRGESEADPQFHVMTSSIQATRRPVLPVGSGK